MHIYAQTEHFLSNSCYCSKLSLVSYPYKVFSLDTDTLGTDTQVIDTFDFDTLDSDTLDAGHAGH